MKASPLLRAWLRRLDAAGVRVRAAASTGPAGMTRSVCRSTRREGRSRSMPMPPCWRSAARAGRGLARTADGPMSLTQAGVDRVAAEAVELRFPRRLVASICKRHAGQPLKRIALSFGDHTRARRGDHHRERDRRRRDLCAVGGTCATRSTRAARPSLHIALRPDHGGGRRSNASSTLPRGKQSLSTFLRKALQPVAGRDRPAAGGHGGKARNARAGRARAARSMRCRSASPASRRSRARSRPRAASRSATRRALHAARRARASSSPARCSTGRRRPAAICCRRVSRPAWRRGVECWSGSRSTSLS